MQGLFNVMSKAKLIKRLKEVGVIRRGKVKLSHAGEADFYVDMKRAWGYPDILKLVSRLIDKKILESVTCVASGGYGGIPLATVISQKYGLKLVLVREESKDHGRGVLIDGYVPNKKDRVLIIDDVMTTGGSMKKMAEILKPTGVKILKYFVIVKRGKSTLPVSHLLSVEELF